jgi:hypothetical protein
MAKKFLLCIFALLVFYKAGGVYNHFSGGFFTYKLAPVLEGDRVEGEEITAILTQEFRYLKRGSLQWAFISEDGRYILKFPRKFRLLSYLTSREWILALPLPRALRDRLAAQEKKMAKKNAEFLQAEELAYTHLKEDSAYVYIHHRLDPRLEGDFALKDKLGVVHKVPKNLYQFSLQLCAQPFLERLQKRDAEGLKSDCRSLAQLFQKRSEMGIVDNDGKLAKNYGFVGDRAVCFDTGKYARASKETSAENALQRSLQELAPYLNSELYERLIVLFEDSAFAPVSATPFL